MIPSASTFQRLLITLGLLRAPLLDSFLSFLGGQEAGLHGTVVTQSLALSHVKTSKHLIAEIPSSCSRYAINTPEVDTCRAHVYDGP